MKIFKSLGLLNLILVISATRAMQESDLINNPEQTQFTPTVQIKKKKTKK